VCSGYCVSSGLLFGTGERNYRLCVQTYRERNLENLRDPFVISSPLLLVNSVDEFGVPQFDCQSNVSLNSNIVVVGACVFWPYERMTGRMNGCCFLVIGLSTVTAQNVV
jgi:hypothetical protein